MNTLPVAVGYITKLYVTDTVTDTVPVTYSEFRNVVRPLGPAVHLGPHPAPHIQIQQIPSQDPIQGLRLRPGQGQVGRSYGNRLWGGHSSRGYEDKDVIVILEVL